MPNESASPTKNQILTELTRSPHGNLTAYVPVARLAAQHEPEFLAHLIAWDRIKGQIRDSKVALPVISLVPGFPEEFTDNSLAHLSLLPPREFLRAYRFAREIQVHGRMRIRHLAERYLQDLESNWGRWCRVAVQHRASLKELYSLARIACPPTVSDILFRNQYPAGSIFESIAQLKNMAVEEAAGTILQRKIPFQIALGALGAKAKEPALVLALIGGMTPTQLTTHVKMLERMGVKKVPALRDAFESALHRAAGSRKATFKTTVAADAVEDEVLQEKLKSLQEQQIAHMATIEGDWLVLGDKSGSMESAIEVSRHVAATLARMVKGRVMLIFFDFVPRSVDVTGKTYDQIKEATQYVTADGGTSIGCGLLKAVESKFYPDGIAVISDGGENAPPQFSQIYRAMSQSTGKQPPVYFYQTVGEPNRFSLSCQADGIDVQTFDLRGGVDYYSLPNLVKTMRANRYDLIQEILDTKLLSLDQTLKPLPRKEVHDRQTKALHGG